MILTAWSDLQEQTHNRTNIGNGPRLQAGAGHTIATDLPVTKSPYNPMYLGKRRRKKKSAYIPQSITVQSPTTHPHASARSSHELPSS